MNASDAKGSGARSSCRRDGVETEKGNVARTLAWLTSPFRGLYSKELVLKAPESTIEDARSGGDAIMSAAETER